jgi:hypothetical protein
MQGPCRQEGLAEDQANRHQNSLVLPLSFAWRPPEIPFAECYMRVVESYRREIRTCRHSVGTPYVTLVDSRKAATELKAGVDQPQNFHLNFQ